MNAEEAKVSNIEGNWQSIEIFLFSNGQQYSPPRKYHLQAEELNWWDATLNQLAQSHYGIRHPLIYLYTTDGHLVESPLELKYGQAYVAVEPPEPFIDAGYQKYLIKASRSWEKRQAKKRNPGTATPEPLMAATGNPELSAAGGHFMSSVHEKSVAGGGNFTDEYGLRSGKVRATVDEREAKSGEHGAKVGKYAAKSGEHRSRPGEHETYSGEYRARLGVYEATPAEYGVRPDVYEVRPAENQAASGGYAAKPGEHGARLGEHEGRLGGHADRPGLYEARPGGHGANPGEHQTRPDEYASRPGEYAARSGEYGATLSKNGRKIIEDAARSGEQRARLDEYRPSSVEAQAGEQTPKLTGYEVGPGDSRPWSGKIGPKIEGYQIKLRESETSLDESEDRPNVNTIQSTKHRSKPGKYGNLHANGETRTDESAADDYGPRLDEHGARLGEHGARPGENGARLDEHGARSGEPKAKSGKHRPSSGETGSRMGEHGPRSSVGSRTDKDGIKTVENQDKFGENTPMSSGHRARQASIKKIYDHANGLNKDSSEPGEHEDRLDKLYDRTSKYSRKSDQNEVITDQGTILSEQEGGVSENRGRGSKQERRSSVVIHDCLDDDDLRGRESDCAIRLSRQHSRINNHEKTSPAKYENRLRGSEQRDREIDPEGRTGGIGEKIGERRVNGHEQRGGQSDHKSRAGDQTSREIEHEVKAGKEKGREIENTRKTSRQRAGETKYGTRAGEQKCRIIEYTHRQTGQKAEEIEYGSRANEQKSREIEHTRKPSGQKAGEIGQGGTSDEPRERKIEHTRRPSEPRASEIENKSRVGEPKSREIEHVGRTGDPRGREFENSGRAGEQRIEESDHGPRRDDQRTRQSDYVARVGDNETRGGDLGVRVGDREIGNLDSRVPELSSRAATPGARASLRNRMSSRARMGEPRLGVPGPRVDETPVRLCESKMRDRVGIPKAKANDIGAKVVEPDFGGTGAAVVSHISEAQQHVRRNSLFAGKPSTVKKRWSVGQYSMSLKRPSPFPISSVLPKKPEDKKPIKTNKQTASKKVAGKAPVAPSNEIGKHKILPRYPYKRITPPAVPPPTTNFDHITMTRKSTSLTRVTSNHKGLATDSAPIENVIGNKEIIVESTNLFRNPESEIKSVRLDLVKDVVDCTRDNPEETQTELIKLQDSIRSISVSERVQTHIEQGTEAVNEYGVSTTSKARVGCTLSSQRDNMVATDDLDENFILILNNGDAVNLKLNIEVRNGGNVTNFCQKTGRKSQLLTNISKTEKESQISMDDDMYTQSKSLQSILHNEYFQGSGFESSPKVVVVQCACCGRQNNPQRCDPPPCCDSKKYFVLLLKSLHEDMDDRCNCEPSCQPYGQRSHLQSKRLSTVVPVKKTFSEISLETVSVSGVPLHKRDTARFVTTTNSTCQTEDLNSESMMTRHKVSITEDSGMRCEFQKESFSEISMTTDAEFLATKNSCSKTCLQICSQINEQEDSQVCSEVCSLPCPQVQSQEYPQICPQVQPQVCPPTCAQVQPQVCPPTCAQVQPQVCPLTCPQEQPQVCPPTCLQEQSQSQLPVDPQISKDVSDSHTQTQWCSVLVSE